MIHDVHGNIFAASADALVNPVNCVGIMGKGLALQFKRAFPNNFAFYESACQLNRVQLGQVLVYENSMAQPQFIINFPTKLHWRDKSYVRDIISGLSDLANRTQELELSSIAIPPLGCGLGGLSWEPVRSLIVAAFRQSTADVYLYGQ